MKECSKCYLLHTNVVKIHISCMEIINSDFQVMIASGKERKGEREMRVESSTQGYLNCI